ncbi:DNA glycosylase AlkZ-like family protein [Shouchella xiaoxiensis]|uniref:DNA glycosylase AlkZ-like family protein n=1 Tax=Shouchella xiaoxiensis TaxID=766895 RepID=UPI001959742B|nr:crosslink repair DNA glycosylase YcaQ family protein [Shouchella xiaoxiensis]
MLLKEGHAFEYIAQAACLLPLTDYPLFADIRHHFSLRYKEELNRYKESTSTILSRLENEGPLASAAFTSLKKVKGGWDTDLLTTKETSHVLQLLFYTGDIQIVNRIGATRYFARTADVIPHSIRHQENDMSMDERAQQLLVKYARAYRLFSSDDPRYGWQRLTASQRKQFHQRNIDSNLFTSVTIEGVKRPYAILTNDLDSLLSHSRELEPSIQFLSPLDPFLWRRERIEDLYSFVYRWEIYTPASKRKIGPYGMPIL